jgi:hypothetical protein
MSSQKSNGINKYHPPFHDNITLMSTNENDNEFAYQIQITIGSQVVSNLNQ